MNINYTQGIVLIVIACVLHTSYAKPDKPLTKSDKPLEKDNSKSNPKDNQKSVNDEKVEGMLLKIATIIQTCIDERTMNNKDFKTRLDNLYNNLVRPKINTLLEKQLKYVNKIQEKYEKNLEVLKIMNSMPDSGSSKKNNKSSKKPGKK